MVEKLRAGARQACNVEDTRVSCASHLCSVLASTVCWYCVELGTTKKAMLVSHGAQLGNSYTGNTLRCGPNIRPSTRMSSLAHLTSG